MTELLELRLKTIFDGIDESVLTLSDAEFMKEFIRAQGRSFENLNESMSQLQRENEALQKEVERLKSLIPKVG